MNPIFFANQNVRELRNRVPVTVLGEGPAWTEHSSSALRSHAAHQQPSPRRFPFLFRRRRAILRFLRTGDYFKILIPES